MLKEEMEGLGVGLEHFVEQMECIIDPKVGRFAPVFDDII